MQGFINVIKPTGVSSGYVVNKIKHLTKEKVGHLGTLDPLASGVLPIAIGKATRFFDYFLDKEKKYFALAKFGIETDTLDSEGKIINTGINEVSLEKIKKVCAEMTGDCLQMPPMYSAKTVGGIRAYEAAIKNINIELKPKKVQIYSINVEKWHKNDIFAINLHCSSGTYVRSVIRDIAKKLNTVATTVAIIRTKSGVFELNDAVSLEELESDVVGHIKNISSVLKMESIILTNDEAKDLYSGKEICKLLNNGMYLSFYENKEFSVVEVIDNKVRNKIYLYEGDIK